MTHPTDPMRDVLHEWKAAFDGHQIDTMASLFTGDVLFQGFGPEVMSGRDAVRGYYEAVPENRSAQVTVVSTYTIGEETVGGFADVAFSDPDGWAASVHMSLVLRREQDRWRIRQYHVSRVVTDE